MIVTLSGSNAFRLQAELQQRMQAFVAQYTDMGLERLDGEEASYDRMREALQSLPFLAAKKLVVLHSPSVNKQFVEHAEALLGDIADTTDVIIIEPKLDKRLSYAKYLQKKTTYIACDELDENGLSRWLADQAKAAGGSLSMADARQLVERVGANQQRLSTELDKLLLHNKTVSRQTIELLTDKTPQSTIFELLDAAFAGNPKKAMQLYEEQRDLRVEPQQIIAMLAWQLHVLAVVVAAGGRDPAAVAKDAKINPYVVRKTAGIARRVTAKEIRQLISQTLTLDVRLKSEGIDADEALRYLILAIAAGKQKAAR